MSNNQELTKLEFLLTLEGNIICQRYFNVRDFNPQATRSMDLHEYVKSICRKISEDLKIKSSNYLCENKEYILGLEDVEDTTSVENEHFLLQIKQNDHVFIQRIFPAYVFHPKVRYTVDIRPMLKNFLTDLTTIMSMEELETTYLGYNL